MKELCKKALVAYCCVGLVAVCLGQNAGKTGGESSFASLRCGPGSCADEDWPKVLDALSQTPRPFDAIWFSTGVAYPPLDWHREQSARCAKAAADLRKIGMSAAVEIQMTIGHSDSMLVRKDCRAQDWATWVGWNGKVAKRSSCPRAKGFRDYFVQVASLYAAWKPECVWIDDDLRLESRVPSSGGRKYDGCWCQTCIGEFSRREGKNWTRETLLAAIEKGDKELERRWFGSQEDGLAEFAGAIAKAVTEVSPETRIGLEAAFCANGVAKILKAMREASGKPVRLRMGDGSYWDRNPHEQLDKAYRIAKTTFEAGCLDLVDVLSPEIESCPRTFSSRTPQGAILEGFEQLAMGANALSMFLSDTRVGEDWQYYRDTLFRRIGAAHDFLKGYEKSNQGTLPCGFTVKGGEVPKELVACRGVPVVCGLAKSLGELPDVNAIPVSLGGSLWQAKGERETIVMQAAAGSRLAEFARQADAVSGGRTPILFTRPVMAWAMPRVREDGELRTVAIINCSIDVQDPVVVRLRGVPANAKIEWVPLHGTRQPLETMRVQGETTVTLPSVGAWDCGYLLVRTAELDSQAAGVKRIQLLPGEYWWGGATTAGREQPFSSAADYPGRNKDGSLRWDMRFWNYRSQIAPLLLSSKGRYVWCEEPFGFEQRDGVLTILPERPAVVEVVEAGRTLREAFRAASARHFPPQGTPDLDFFRYPILNTWVEHNYWQSESNTVSYARKFLEFVPPGVFMIDCTWQRNFGNWEFDPGRYPDPKRMVKTMNDMGYRMMLWMAPMVSTDGMTYCMLRGKDALLHGDGLHGIAEVNYWAGKNTVIDCTNPAGYGWLKGCLEHLMTDYGIEGFFFDAGDVRNYPKTARPYRKGATSCEQAAAFHNLGDTVPLQQHRASWKSGGKARMCTLFDRDVTYAEIKASIAEMLNAGLLGYPFINADMVGGGQVDCVAPFLNSPPAYFEYPKERQEFFLKKGPKWHGAFYVRFLQMECLSPMVQFSFAPWHLDESFHQIVKDMVALRQKWVPYIVECAKACGKTGEPMMRSMEYMYPSHGWEKVDDQFLMGDRLLVAPQVYEGATSRKVVIPPGTWKADDGQIYEGPATVEVATPLERLPHFVKTFD